MAAERKVAVYDGLARALTQLNSPTRRRVEVLLRVDGIRRVLDVAGITRALGFLGVPAQKGQGLLRATAVASVEALEFLHRVCESANQKCTPVGPGLHFGVDRDNRGSCSKYMDQTATPLSET